MCIGNDYYNYVIFKKHNHLQIFFVRDFYLFFFLNTHFRIIDY